MNESLVFPLGLIPGSPQGYMLRNTSTCMSKGIAYNLCEFQGRGKNEDFVRSLKDRGTYCSWGLRENLACKMYIYTWGKLLRCQHPFSIPQVTSEVNLKEKFLLAVTFGVEIV